MMPTTGCAGLPPVLTCRLEAVAALSGVPFFQITGVSERRQFLGCAGGGRSGIKSLFYVFSNNGRCLQILQQGVWLIGMVVAYNCAHEKVADR
jgi:hypothetical protein